MKNGVLAILIAFAVGCASMSRVVYDSQNRQPTENIEVFTDGQMPARHYKVIAELMVKGQREDELSIQAQMITEGKRLGCAGLIFQPEPSGNRDLFGHTDWVFKGKVVVYEP